MSDKKGVGSKILGIFVESEQSLAPEPESQGSAAEEVAKLAQQGAPPELPVDAAKLPVSGALSDFDAVFRDAGMDATELDRVKKAEELLRTLPEGTPLPVRKQIVEASLKAFGFDVHRIVAAAQNQKRALDAFVHVNETATAKAIGEAQAQIKELNDRIAALRQDVDRRNARLASLTQVASARKGDVQRVVDFFQGTQGASTTP